MSECTVVCPSVTEYAQVLPVCRGTHFFKIIFSGVGRGADGQTKILNIPPAFEGGGK